MNSRRSRGADLIFYVISATAGLPDAWPFLSHLGRDVLKRLVFVVWQSDRVSSEEGANAVKRLRQAMLKNLGQACPIFIGSTTDRAGREKLERWIESEVIFSEPRRAKLREVDEVARAALRRDRQQAARRAPGSRTPARATAAAAGKSRRTRGAIGATGGRRALDAGAKLRWLAAARRGLVARASRAAGFAVEAVLCGAGFCAGNGSPGPCFTGSATARSTGGARS